jgi:hypothetical protein
MNVLFAAQDPGGKNAIAPVLAALKAEGAEVGESIESPDIFIAGTSAGDSPDKRIMQGIGKTPSLYVLDFWLNYWQRFSTPGKKDFAHLPTRICVMDDIARDEMLAEGFPKECLVVTGNPHFDHFADMVTREHEDPHRILFVSQPISATRDMPGYTSIGYDEYQVMQNLLQILETLPEPYYLSLRLHPKEPADKYAEYLGPRVRRAPEATVEEALSASGLVVGMASPVLIQAVAAGKKVLSYEPGLIGLDSLVSNRAGVTTRIENKEELSKALREYFQGEWPFTTRPMRDVWPSGATERVVKEVHRLVKNI